MDSKQQTTSVILKLMGLDQVPPRHDPVTDRQKVLSEDYLQKVASIGIRKKRSSRQHHSIEKEESDYVLKVVKTIRRDKNHNPSKGNGKENVSFYQEKVIEGVQQQLLDAAVVLKPETWNSRIVVSKVNHGKGGIGLKYSSFLKSRQNSRFGKQSSRSCREVSEKGSMQTGNVGNGVLDTVSSSFFRGNGEFVKGNDMLESASNVSVNKIQCNSMFSCSDSSYVGSEASMKTLERRDVTEKLQDVRQRGCDSTDQLLPVISKHGNGARNSSRQSGFSNEKFKRKVGVNYRFARKVPMTITLREASVIADNGTNLTNDDLFQKYWGLRKNASANCSTKMSKNQNIIQRDCSEDVNLRSRSEKSPSSLCPAFIDSQILQQKCLMKDGAMKNTHEDSNMSKQSSVYPDLSVNCLVSDGKTEVVATRRNCDSLSHTSLQQNTSEFQEDSAFSICSVADPDSVDSFHEAYEPSPISVLDPTFIEDISSISQCDAGEYDSSEVDDGLDMNVSSDEECENESVGDFAEKKEIVGLTRTEESRDFSYVVEVLTEAGISNRSLFKDFSTWHTAECPISPSVFEILEKKFGEQQQWKRCERRLLFDRINLGLLEILQPPLYVPKWEKPVSRRVIGEPSQDMIAEEMWGLLVSQEKKAGKDLEDDMLGGEIRWIEIYEDVEDIVRNIVKLLIEELANEIDS